MPCSPEELRMHSVHRQQPTPMHLLNSLSDLAVADATAGKLVPVPVPESASTHTHSNPITIGVTPSSTAASAPGLDSPSAFTQNVIFNSNSSSPSCPTSLRAGNLLSRPPHPSSFSLSPSSNSTPIAISARPARSRNKGEALKRPPPVSPSARPPRTYSAASTIGTLRNGVTSPAHDPTPAPHLPSDPLAFSTHFASESAVLSLDGDDYSGLPGADGDNPDSENEGARALVHLNVNAGGKQLKRPRKDKPATYTELDLDADRVVRAIAAAGEGMRSYDSRVISFGDESDDARPAKKARIYAVSKETGTVNVSGPAASANETKEISLYPSSRPASQSPPARSCTPPEASFYESTREKSRSPSRMSISPSPVAPNPSSLLRRPSPSRIHSSSSCSTISSGPPFPSTPPSHNAASPPVSSTSVSAAGISAASCCFTSAHAPPAHGSAAPQPFWFDDGDLVLIISSPSSTVSCAPTPSLQCPDPFASSAATFSFSSSSSSSMSTAQMNIDFYPSPSLSSTSTPSSPISFRIHASRLAQASSAFESLLSSPLPRNPTKEDSARAAREIARELSARGKKRRGLEDEHVRFAEALIRKKVGFNDREEERVGHEVVGGCPAVRLEGDSPRDWIVTLEAIYEPMSFQIRPLVFDTLASVMRISTRYCISVLREWAIAQLRTTWPSQLERMSPIALPNAADAIALARECDVPDILPAAFYALSVQRWRPAPSVPTHTPHLNSKATSTLCSGDLSRLGASPFPTTSSLGVGGDTAGGTDGGRAHAVLDPMDMRRLVAGREALQDILVEIIACPLVVGQSMLPEGDGLNAQAYGQAQVQSFGAVPGGMEVFGMTKVMQELSGGNMNGYRPPSPSPSRSPSPKMPSLSPSLSVCSNSRSMSVGLSNEATFPASSNDGIQMLSEFVAAGQRTFTFCPSSGVGGTRCRSTLEKLWRAKLVPDRRRAWGTWLARELYRVATLPIAHLPYELAATGYCATANHPPCNDTTNGSVGIGVSGGDEKSKTNVEELLLAGKERGSKSKTVTGIEAEVCARCWGENRRLALWRLDWLCAAIPGMFLL